MFGFEDQASFFPPPSFEDTAYQTSINDVTRTTTSSSNWVIFYLGLPCLPLVGLNILLT